MKKWKGQLISERLTNCIQSLKGLNGFIYSGGITVKNNKVPSLFGRFSVFAGRYCAPPAKI